MSKRLAVQRNGAICAIISEPGIVQSRFAREVTFAIEYKTTASTWHRVATYSDPQNACLARKEASPHYSWRLVALAEECEVVLPANWQPYQS